MIMTSSILFLLIRLHFSQAEFLKKNNYATETVKKADSESVCHEGIAYVMDSCCWQKEYGNLTGYAFIVTGGSPAIPATDQGAAVIYISDVSAADVLTYLSEKMIRFFHTDALTEQMAVSETEEAATVLQKLLCMYRRIYPCEFSLNDKYLNTLYMSEKFMEQLGEPEACTLTEDHAQVLLSCREFHKANSYTSAFYYTDTYTGRVFLCKNVFSEGIYVMRLVSFCDTLPADMLPGLEELLSRLAQHIGLYLKYHPKVITVRHPKDSLHNLVRTGLCKNVMNHTAVSEILNQYGWKEEDSFLLTKYTFSEDALPENYTKSSLPYLCSRLEGMYEFSCTILEEEAIFHLIDLTAMHMENNLGVLLEQTSLMVRENICNAGISDPFDTFSCLPDARCQTEEALKLGKRVCPDRWCFSFREYWEDYVLEQVQKNIQPQMLCDPRVLQLMEYDRKNHTELAESLYVYLTCLFNGAVAAETLHIHRTTFFRRLERIQKLVPLHLEQENDLFALLLSYKLMKPVRESRKKGKQTENV